MSQILTLTDISYCYPGAPEPLFEHLSATFAAGWAAVLGDNGGLRVKMCVWLGVSRGLDLAFLNAD